MSDLYPLHSLIESSLITALVVGVAVGVVSRRALRQRAQRPARPVPGLLLTSGGSLRRSAAHRAQLPTPAGRGRVRPPADFWLPAPQDIGERPRLRVIATAAVPAKARAERPDLSVVSGASEPAVPPWPPASVRMWWAEEAAGWGHEGTVRG